MSPVRRLSIPVFVAAFAVFASSCGGGASECNASNCAGCCSSDGKCEQPSSQTCGAGGTACFSCQLGQVCNGSTCSTPSVVGGGSGSTGGGSGTDAGTGGGDGSTGGGSAATGGGDGATGGGTATTGGGDGATGGGTATTGGGDGATGGGTTATGGGSASTGGGTGASDAGTDDPTCGGTLRRCNNACTDTLADENNCGACGNQCSSGRVCSGGSCVPLPTDCVAAGGCAPGFSCDPVSRQCSVGCRLNSECPAGGTCNTGTSTCSCSGGGHACGQTCVANDANACGNSCVVCPAVANAMPTCNGSTCDFACNPGTLRCQNACATCTTPANATPVCNGAACEFTCNAGFHRCGNQCLANNSVDSCGSSCTACPGAAEGNAVCNSNGTCACANGSHLCGNACVSDSSVNSCGASCTPCPGAAQGNAVCNFGFPFNTCACAPGTQVCGGQCVSQALATCSGHGTCSGNSGAPACVCTSGYAGPTCASCAATHQDNDNNGICNVRCAGYSPSNCSGHGTCSDADGSAECTCQAGWHGAECQHSNFVRVVTGAFHSCGLRANGTVECWGDSDLGQSTVPTGLLATDLAAGTYWTCALRSTGGVKCWGDLTGTGNTPMDNANGKPATGSFRALFGGGGWACAQANTTGAMTCFGINSTFVTASIAVGMDPEQNNGAHAFISAANGAIGALNIPGTPPTFSGGYAEIDCGERYCCAIQESRAVATDRLQGGVQCWGNNAPADGSGAGRVTNTPAVSEKYALISAGDATVCGIRSTPTVAATDLRLKCWGASSLATTMGGQFVDVSIGWRHACAVELQGGIRCWGSNLNGEAPSWID